MRRNQSNIRCVSGLILGTHIIVGLNGAIRLQSAKQFALSLPTLCMEDSGKIPRHATHDSKLQRRYIPRVYIIAYMARYDANGESSCLRGPDVSITRGWSFGPVALVGGRVTWNQPCECKPYEVRCRHEGLKSGSSGTAILGCATVRTLVSTSWSAASRIRSPGLALDSVEYRLWGERQKGSRDNADKCPLRPNPQSAHTSWVPCRVEC